MSYQPDIAVTMTFLGGTPVSRVPVFFTKETRISFFYPNESFGWYCVFFSDDDRMAFPGEIINGWVSFLDPVQQRGKLHVGTPFEFHVGLHRVCIGTVLHVINPQLLSEIPEQDR